MAPSLEHDALIELLRLSDAQQLSQLAESAGAVLPEMTTVREASADASEVIPVTFTADAVFVLGEPPNERVLLVEVQRRKDLEKRFSWPVYVANLHARFRCPVILLVICERASVARWAATPLTMGAGHTVTPHVLGPGNVEIPSAPAPDEPVTLSHVLGAVLHAKNPEAGALANAIGDALLAERSSKVSVCYQLLGKAFGKPFVKHMEDAMGARNWIDEWIDQSPILTKLTLQGKAEGKAEGEVRGKASALLAVLGARGILLTDAQRERVQACQDHAVLDAWLLRALTATHADEVLGA